MPYHCLFQLPFQAGSPSITQAFCSGVSWDQAVSRGMAASPAYLTRSFWQSAQAGVCSGLMAPPRSVFVPSGMTRPKSTPMTRPKPRQVGQAPAAELNENMPGVGAL